MATLVNPSTESVPVEPAAKEQPSAGPLVEESEEIVTFQEFLDELDKFHKSAEDNVLDDFVGLTFDKLTKKDIEMVCKGKFAQTINTNPEGKLLALRSHGDKTIEMDYYEYEGSWYNTRGEKVLLSKINPKLANYISKIKNEQPCYVFSQIINQYCVENKSNKIIEKAISETENTPRVICGIVGKMPRVEQKNSSEKSTRNKDSAALKYRFLGKLKPYGIFETEISLPTGQNNTHKFYVFCK